MSRTVDPDDLVGDVVAGVRIDEILSRSLAGAVVRGWDVETGRGVAMRMLHADTGLGDEAVRRLEREFRATCRLEHPNLVRNLRMERIEGFVLMVMEFVAGADLGRMVSGGEPVPLPRAARIAIQLARVVHYLHEQGFVHRDIKPSNVFVAEGGTVRLGDLELIKSLCPSPESAVTATGMLVGSPAYLAPEIMFDDRPASPSTDLYSLGATLYHLFAGIPPYSGRSPIEVLKRVRSGPPLPVGSANPTLPDRLAAVIHSLLARVTSERPSSAEEAARRIEEAMNEEAPWPE